MHRVGSWLLKGSSGQHGAGGGYLRSSGSSTPLALEDFGCESQINFQVSSGFRELVMQESRVLHGQKHRVSTGNVSRKSLPAKVAFPDQDFTMDILLLDSNSEATE